MTATDAHAAGHESVVRDLRALLLLGIGCAGGSLGCGSRTGLGLTADPGAPVGDSDASDGAATGSGGDYGLCDPANGPVPYGEGVEGDERCTASFPKCVDLGGQWVCCSGPGPYDGPTGDCMFL